MKLIKFIFPGVFPENVRNYYFSLEELKTFSYDSSNDMWQFEFISGKQTYMIGHSKIDLHEFEGFLFTDNPLIIFENRPFKIREDGSHYEEMECHLREVKKEK